MKKIPKLITGAFVLLLSIGLAACGQTAQDDSVDDGKLQVFTTFYPMYDFAKNVVGDEGTVDLLIPAGTEPHDYEPSARDIAKIADADVFIYNSEDMETWVGDILDNIDTDKVLVIEASEGIDLLEGTDHEGHDHEAEESHEEPADHDHEHAYDPHVWLDPVLAKQEVATIEQKLAQKFTDQATVFEKNGAAYQQKLTDLDLEFQQGLEGAANRTFVTQHAAFSYLAKRYDLTQESISGISPDEEPSPSRLAELKDYVKDHQIHVIYFEKTASSKIAETLASETGVTLAVLNPLESLTKQEQEAGEDYLSVMRENLAALQKSIN